MTTRAEDNTLCLSCHVGFPPYQGLAAQDLAGGGNARVRDAVVEHMREKGKFVSKEDYDPSGSGLGACVECHMPKLGISGGATTDAAGWVKGDLRSHVFLPVWPSASEATTGGLRGMTNSCSGCHAPLNGLGGRIIWEWGRNRGARPTTYHASTPLPEQAGIVNPTDPSGGVRCIACHTARGFEEIQVMGNDLLQPTDQPLVDEILRQSVERDVGVACAACHGRDPMGDSNRLNLSFPVPELCERCHNAATVTGADFLAVGETPQPPTAEMLAGTAGAESPAGGYTNSPHTFQATCDLCHLTPLPDNTHVEHGFAPNLGMCNQSPCHSAAPLGSFDRPSPDYDGDGLATGVQTEVRGLLALLEAQLLASPNIYRSTNGRWFVDADPLGGGYPGDDVARRLQAPAVTDAERRAVFNWYSVDEEGSYGVHNTARSVRLLQQSYLELGAPEPPWMRR